MANASEAEQPPLSWPTSIYTAVGLALVLGDRDRIECPVAIARHMKVDLVARRLHGVGFIATCSISTSSPVCRSN